MLQIHLKTKNDPLYRHFSATGGEVTLEGGGGRREEGGGWREEGGGMREEGGGKGGLHWTHQTRDYL